MQPNSRTALASKIMNNFAERTGLAGVGPAPKRYLWTDAFAVCNFLELGRQTGDPRYEDLARRLVDQVHHVLGRHRGDDGRSGWLSGLHDQEGEAHPTRGGLRIGKPLPERRPDEPFDEQREWERDGQYYHYLTKWMLALNRLARQTGTTLFNRWAMELARAAHDGFAYLHPSAATPLMHWKMSIDLSRPLVAGMGHHDPLDGLLTFYELQAAAAGGGQGQAENLASAIRDLARMCKGQDWRTDDPLGLGGLLSDALRAARLMVDDPALPPKGLLADLLDAAAKGISYYASRGDLHLPAAHRLAFRELGLAIGLHAAQRLEELLRLRPELHAWQDRLAPHLQEILRHLPLCSQIEEFWLSAEHQRAASWAEHLDINTVMLATSLAPDGYFGYAKQDHPATSRNTEHPPR